MKNILLVIILFVFISTSVGQASISTKLGNVTLEELQTTTYALDTTAAALVLYEHGNHYVNERKNLRNTTDYYRRIKIFSSEGFSKATITIPLYKDESVDKIKGITYNISTENSMETFHLEPENIFTKQIDINRKEVVFSLPNVKEGSVLEYVYSVTSPYSGIDDWKFQEDIPKLKSEFTALILGNWKYNIRLVGFLPLDINNVDIKKKCVYVSGAGSGSCLQLQYSMLNIPIFYEENYMISAENYKSKLVFDLESFTDVKGFVTDYTKTWKDADTRLKKDFLDNQVAKQRFFAKQLPQDLVSVTDEYQKAYTIFNYIKNHYEWNGKYWPSRKVNIKKAFSLGSGNIFDINLSLYNALKALNLDAYLVLSSTRDRARPTRLYPIIYDFNYLIVKLNLDDKVYYLDATQKEMPFGMVQFQALNGDGRVFDFKNGSYWEPINSINTFFEKHIIDLTLAEDLSLRGSIESKSKGYAGFNKRHEIIQHGEEAYIADFEENNPYIEVDSYTPSSLNAFEEDFSEYYKVTFDVDFGTESTLYINPFTISRWSVNPFKLKERNYPVDFGYPRSYYYYFNLTLPKNLRLEGDNLKKSIRLPDGGGRFILNSTAEDDTVKVFFKLTLTKQIYQSDVYDQLKEFFNQVIKSQNTNLKLVKISE